MSPIRIAPSLVDVIGVVRAAAPLDEASRLGEPAHLMVLVEQRPAVARRADSELMEMRLGPARDNPDHNRAGFARVARTGRVSVPSGHDFHAGGSAHGRKARPGRRIGGLPHRDEGAPMPAEYEAGRQRGRPCASSTVGGPADVAAVRTGAGNEPHRGRTDRPFAVRSPSVPGGAQNLILQFPGGLDQRLQRFVLPRAAHIVAHLRRNHVGVAEGPLDQGR